MNRIPRHLALALTLLALSMGSANAQASNNNQGRNLAATCANCHGTNGQARGDMKSLAGMPAETLTAMIANYRNGNLPATIMHQIAKGYTDEQIRLIAAYFAAQSAKP